MIRICLLGAVLALALTCGCDKKETSGPVMSVNQKDFVGYTLVRDVKAGEELTKAMIQPVTIHATTATDTGNDDVMKEFYLTSADLPGYLGKSFRLNVNKDDCVQKSMFK